MKQKTSKPEKKIQSLAHKSKKSTPMFLSEEDEFSSFIDIESDLVQFQHEYEFAPEHRFFN